MVKAHIPSKEMQDQVMALVYLGTEHNIIAKILGIRMIVLTKKYHEQLKNGAAVTAALLGMKVVKSAIDGDKGALNQIARAQGIGRPLQERPQPNANDDEAAPLPDINNATDDDLNELLATLVGGAKGGNSSRHKG